MSKNQYRNIASVYDSLNSGYDYKDLAQFLAKEIQSNEKVKSSLVLDLGCGTGKVTFLLRELGYDMTGVDISEEMLSVARNICVEKDISDILWLCQDMRSFELYGTVDACVCTLDSLNYLTGAGDLKKCFSLVHNYLIPDGVFVFDINTPYRYKNIYGENDYILEDENDLCAWQNEYDEKSRLCRFYLSVFSKKYGDVYERRDEIQTQRCYSMRQIKKALSDTGFEIIHISGNFDGKAADENDEKWYFTARAIKE